LSAAYGLPATLGKLSPRNAWVYGRVMLDHLSNLAQIAETAERDLAAWRPDLDARRLTNAAVSLATELFIAGGDPVQPRFAEFIRPDRKLAGDNPGTWYHTACLNPEATYVISGNLSAALYVGVQVYTTAHGWNLPSGNLGGATLATDASGNFTVILGGEDPGSGVNWLPLGENDRTVIVRHYYRDRYTPCPPITISWTGGSTDTFDGALAIERAGTFIDQVVRATMEITDLMESEAMNAYPGDNAEVKVPHYGGALYPTRDISYTGCFVQVGANERLVLRGPQTKALYSSYVFYDPYFTSLEDPAARLTDEDVKGRFGDGPFTISIAASDPNDGSLWLSTTGMRNGIVAIRHLFGENEVQPTTSVEPLA